MRIDLKKMSWNEFKDVINKNEPVNESYYEPIYRGHAKKEWMLETTLYRLINENSIDEKYYYDIVTETKKEYPGIFGKNTNFSPRLTDEPLAPLTVSHLVTLRHLGFPSPILDWSSCPFIAAFFAISNMDSRSEIAIYCLKKSKRQCSYNINVPILDTITHKEIEQLILELKINIPHSRHHNQKASYTWCINNKSAPNRQFYLAAIDELNDESQKFQIVKYIITDSVNNRSNILKEIYDLGISFNNLFGVTHIHENSLLKDVAVRKFYKI